MRIIDIVGQRLAEGAVSRRYEYLGNCTDRGLAPYLSDMMEQEKKVSYKEVYAAVGRDALAGIFGDFFWGQRPNRRRGNMALHQDPYVSFYKSKFRGIPCYFIQESGIEYVFVSAEYFAINWDVKRLKRRNLYIQSNGTVTSTILQHPDISVVIVGDTMQVVQSAALTDPTIKALLSLIVKHHPERIDDDGEDMPVDEYIEFLEAQRQRSMTEAVTIGHHGSFKAKDSKLDYDGADFDKWHILDDRQPIGEITVQRGRTSVTVRNIIIYDAGRTGKGIGKQVYALLRSHYRNKKLRSSYDTNTSNGATTTGLSAQAIQMWDSLVAQGLATKQTVGDRFYYEML